MEKKPFLVLSIMFFVSMSIVGYSIGENIEVWVDAHGGYYTWILADDVMIPIYHPPEEGHYMNEKILYAEMSLVVSVLIWAGSFGVMVWRGWLD